MNRISFRASLVSCWLVLICAVAVPGQGQQKQPRPSPPQKVVRLNHTALQALAINRVEAVYPPSAMLAKINGTVTVQVAIDENGSVSSARALSGHPLLRDAAVDAARGWSFKPAVVQGKAVSVVGTLTFTFKLPEHLVRDRTIQRLKQQTAANQKNPTLHYRLGREYESNEQFADALRAYTRAVDLRPDFAEALIAIGGLSMKLNQYDAALEAYNKAVLLKLTTETKAAAYSAIAKIHFRRDEFQKSVEPFKHAIALAPQGSLYFDLALSYLKLGDKASAMDQYRFLREINSILAEQLRMRINEGQ